MIIVIQYCFSNNKKTQKQFSASVYINIPVCISWLFEVVCLFSCWRLASSFEIWRGKEFYTTKNKLVIMINWIINFFFLLSSLALLVSENSKRQRCPNKLGILNFSYLILAPEIKSLSSLQSVFFNLDVLLTWLMGRPFVPRSNFAYILLGRTISSKAARSN